MKSITRVALARQRESRPRLLEEPQRGTIYGPGRHLQEPAYHLPPEKIARDLQSLEVRHVGEGYVVV